MDQDEGLSKMLDSESSSEDEEKKKKKASCGYADLAILVGSPLNPKSLGGLLSCLFFKCRSKNIVKFIFRVKHRQTDEGIHREAMLLKTVVQIGVEYNSA